MREYRGRVVLAPAFAFPVLFCVATLATEEPKANEAPANRAAVAAGPRPKITISKETTYITEPLRADGMVDYVAAVNRRFSQGVTLENNSAVLFLQALGPKHIDEDIRKPFFERLGIVELPTVGNYFVLSEDFFQQKMGWKVRYGETIEDQAKVQEMWDRLWRARRVPWSKEDYPLVAALLDRNDGALRLIMKGSKRPRFYLPLLSTESGRFAHVSITDLRYALEQLAARAMWRLRNRQLDLAWDDVIVCFRTARLRNQGPSVGDSLAGVVCEGPAFSAAIALAQYGTITGEVARQWQSDLRKLPRKQTLGASVNYGDRLESLATILNAAEHGYRVPDVLAKVGLPPDPTFKAMFGLDDVHQRAYRLYTGDPRIDWDEALRYVNIWHDRLVAACEQPSYRRSHNALVRLADEGKQRAREALEQASLPANAPTGGDFFTALLEAVKKDTRAAKQGDLRLVYEIASKRDAAVRKQTEQAVRRASLPRGLTPKQIARHFVDLVLGPVWEAVDTVLKSDTEEQARMNLLCLVLGLAAYHHDHGAYPKTLTELTPKYITEIPKDPFTDGEMRYGRRIGGCLLYSLGPNGKDDGGRNYCNEEGGPQSGSDPSWDDIVICVPPRKLEAGRER